ncbi:MAG: hypothetical protein ABSG00_06920 [Terracidiphilus sp.]
MSDGRSDTRRRNSDGNTGTGGIDAERAAAQRGHGQRRQELAAGSRDGRNKRERFTGSTNCLDS